MKITVAEESGFCFGVKLAVDSANLALQDNQTVYCLGQLIHNNSVTDDLQERGLVVVNDINQVPDNAKVIFRSHGVAKSVYEIAKSKNLEVIDSTCPFVSKIHRIVQEHYLKGFKIIIVGKRSHPEVIGINGWCQNSATIVESEEELTPLDLTCQYCVVTQTTNNQELWKKIIKKIEENKSITFDFFDTICYTTNIRQSEAKVVSLDSDIMLVLGNKQSANTNKLLGICKTNCVNSFLVSSLLDLQGIDERLFAGNPSVGITAGASTPYEFVQQVVDYLQQRFDINPELDKVSGFV